MTFGSLFTGCGGLDLGLERAGWQCRWQCEIDGYATQVLHKLWPNVRKHGDVKTFAQSAEEWMRVDCIAGGFPCQDISIANTFDARGLEGDRSGLWREYVRILRTLRPRYVIVENVSALLIRGMDGVLGDLAALRYDAEWGVLSGFQFGAAQIRERVFIVAYPQQERRGKVHEIFKSLAHQSIPQRTHVELRRGFGGRVRAFPHADVFGMADDVANWAYRLGCCGNAVIPDKGEWIGRRILEAENRRPNP